MVPFKIKFDIDTPMIINPKDSDNMDNNHFQRTVKNLNKMLTERRKVAIVNPTKELNPYEIEEYRKYFCSRAKRDQINYVYFTIPVVIRTEA